MVPKYVANKTKSSMRRMWCSSSTLSSDVYIAYTIKRSISIAETTSEELDVILFKLSLLLGILGEEGEDEDIHQGNGDS